MTKRALVYILTQKDTCILVVFNAIGNLTKVVTLTLSLLSD